VAFNTDTTSGNSCYGTHIARIGAGLGRRRLRPQPIEFDSFVRHGIPVIAVVGNDAGWTRIAREQVKMLGDDVGTALARTDYDRVAAGLGAEGIVVRTQAELPAALARAQALARSGRPVLVNVWLDRSGFREGSISM
jgi:acetolactate synthase-1/2/3 large subunit